MQSKRKIFLFTCPLEKHYIKFGCLKPTSVRVLVKKVLLKTQKTNRH